MWPTNGQHFINTRREHRTAGMLRQERTNERTLLPWAGVVWENKHCGPSFHAVSVYSRLLHVTIPPHLPVTCSFIGSIALKLSLWSPHAIGLVTTLQMSGHKYETCLMVSGRLRRVTSSVWDCLSFEPLSRSATETSLPTEPIQCSNQVSGWKEKNGVFKVIKHAKSDSARNEPKVAGKCLDKQHVVLRRQKSCFPSSLSDRTAERLQLSGWWIPLRAHIWQVFVVNIILSASPVGSLWMQIPVAAVFYDTCSCFPGRPRQVSRRGLANQDGKTRDGRTGRPAQLSASSLVYLHPLPPLSSQSQLCHLCSHQSFS